MLTGPPPHSRFHLLVGLKKFVGRIAGAGRARAAPGMGLSGCPTRRAWEWEYDTIWGGARGSAAMATIAFALGWELLYQLVKRLLVARSSHEKVRDYGASYAVAFIHAAVVSALGAAQYIAMRDLPESSKAVVDPADPHHEQSRDAVRLAYIFFGWLLYDLVHVVINYPKLGGADTLAHHLGFLAFGVFSFGYALFPFCSTWLLLSELSSLPLNARWFLIQTGRGDTNLFVAVNAIFALSFAVVPVALFGLGLAHQARACQPARGPRHPTPTLPRFVSSGLHLATGGARPAVSRAAPTRRPDVGLRPVWRRSQLVLDDQDRADRATPRAKEAQGRVSNAPARGRGAVKLLAAVAGARPSPAPPTQLVPNELLGQNSRKGPIQPPRCHVCSSPSLLYASHHSDMPHGRRKSRSRGPLAAHPSIHRSALAMTRKNRPRRAASVAVD